MAKGVERAGRAGKVRGRSDRGGQEGRGKGKDERRKGRAKERENMQTTYNKN